MRSELPIVVRALVRLTVPRRWRETVLGDLEERLHAEIAAGCPRRAADRRLIAETLRSAAAFTAPAFRRAPRRGHRAPVGEPAMHAFLTDLRYAARSLRRAPGFTLVATLTLALGIGTVTAFGGLFDAVLLRSLPFAEPDRLIQMWSESVDRPGGRGNMSHPDYADVRRGTDAFEQLAIFHRTHSTVTEPGAPPERVPSLMISPNFFATLGLEPTFGRGLSTDDDSDAAPPVVALGAEYWRQRFGADRAILGRTLRVDETLRTVIGVAPEGLHFPRPSDVYLPIRALSGLDVRGVHSQQVIGRLAPGYDLRRAQAEIDPIAAQLRAAYPGSNADRGFRVDPLHESVVGEVRGQLSLVAAAAGFLLLVVCANLSSLLLERTTRRQREIATRAALGASRRQLVRGFLAESSLLVVLGLVGGLAVAHIAQRLLLAFGPELPRPVTAGLDGRTLLLAGGVTAVVGALFALIPSASVLGRAIYRRLAVGVVGPGSVGGQRWRAAFVTVQIALAVVLTLGAALLMQSLRHLYAAPLGYDEEGVLAVDLEVPTPFISPQWPRTVAFYEQLIDRLESTPGVASAAAAHQHPASPGWQTSFTIEGEPAPPVGQEPAANFRPVTAGYFDLMGIPLLAGRVYDESLRSEPPGRVIVNHAFVRAHLGGVTPPEALGRRLVRDSWWNREIDAYEIIGVVGDVRFAGRDRPAEPALYLPHRIDATPMMSVLVRAETGLDPLRLLQPLREAVGAIDPEMAVGGAATLEERLGDTVASRRFITFLLSAFAAVTLALAALGLYGTLAFTTARRTRELGLRMALGARAPDVRRLIFGDAVRLTAIGLAVGLVASLWATRGLESLLVGVERGDAATVAGVAVLLGAVALVAGYLPAWRATRIDPRDALAEE